MKYGKLFTFGLILGLAACIPAAPLPATPVFSPTPIFTQTVGLAATLTNMPLPTGTPAIVMTSTPPVPPTSVATPLVLPTVPEPDRDEESILIGEPGPGSRVISPIRVAGVSDPTFEQNLVVRVLLDDGSEVSLTPVTIQADVGQRGEFAVEVPVEMTEERNLFIQVYAASARDGGITHLSSTGVLFTPAGPENIVVQQPQPEQIAIFQPQMSATFRGGTAHVEGFALASFEQTLLVEVLDGEGNVVGSQPVIVQSAGPGIPGPFSADVAFSVSAAGPGRVVVRDVSPAFGGDSHLSSVEVNLEP